MTWKCAKCGTDNLDYLDVCRTCGTGKDGQVKNQQRLDDWKRGNTELATVAEETQKTSEALNSIIISTGDIKEPYQILDAIFAFDSHSSGFFSGANPEKAFDGVKSKLRKRCLEIGGDAVVNCQFEYRVTLATSAGAVFREALVGGTNINSDKSQAIEIFAYGTAVKLKKVEGQA